MHGCTFVASTFLARFGTPHVTERRRVMAITFKRAVLDRSLRSP